MNLIKPIPITGSNFVSSSVGEPASGEAEWAGGTTYGLADRVIVAATHTLYQSLQASNTGHAVTDGAWWVEVGPTSRWSMFDQSVGTVTTATASLSVVVAPGSANALALLELTGTGFAVTVTRDGDPVYSATGDLDGTVIGDWYAYWFEPYVQRSAVVLTDLPAYADGVITVTVTGTGAVGCGNLVVGNAYDIGFLQQGAKFGIIDFSRKERNDFGAYDVTERAFAKTLSGDLFFSNDDFDRNAALFASVRATPCVFEGVPGDYRFSSLILYGIYTSFSFDTRYPNHSVNTLAIESYI